VDMSSYLKLPEVAHRLGVSEKTARRYIKSGSLPSVFIGNAYRVEPDALTEFVEHSRGSHQSSEQVSTAPKSPSRPSPEARDELDKELRVNVEDLEDAADTLEGHKNRWNTELDLLEKVGAFPYGKAREVERLQQVFARNLQKRGLGSCAAWAVREGNTDASERERRAARRLMNAIQASELTVDRARVVEQKLLPETTTTEDVDKKLAPWFDPAALKDLEAFNESRRIEVEKS
jgi:excisionase family DNA binding protein